jgi:hypothetical protein
MRRYYVYVVELRPMPGRIRRSAKPDVYVGSSAFPPSKKLALHRSSAKGSRQVRKRGIRLLPRLYAGVEPTYTREDAQHQEKMLRARLERQGYRVFGACSPRRQRACWL